MENLEDTFAGLIAPISVADFLANYWEKDFLHLSAQHSRYSRYFSLLDFDKWLSAPRGHLYVSAPQARTKTQKYRPQEISSSFAYSAFARGCLLVLGPLNDWPSLQDLVKALGKFFHAGVNVEAFLSPPKTRIFPPYVAGHDVLILQLEGERIWNLHEFRLLQINPLQKKNLKFPPTWYGRTKAPVIAEICLKPGDLLFVPRGMPHQAVAQNGTSLHLDFGITPFVWMDFLKLAAECAAVHADELRRALPPGFVEDQEISARLRHVFDGVMKTFQAVTSFDEVLAAVRRNRIKLQGFPPDGQFVQLAALGELTSNSEVERRRNLSCAVDEVMDADRKLKAAIFFGTEYVAGPLHLRRAMEFIRDHDRFRLSEVPGLNEQGQLVLVRRLILEGLLRQVPTAERIVQPEPAATVSS
jgi:hypothetical protein